MIGWVRFLAGIPFAYFHVKSPSPLEMGAYFGFLSLLANRGKLNAKRILVGLAIVFAAFVILFPASEHGRKDLEITFLDIGQGDSAFLRLPNGATILIDGGPRANFDSGKFIVLPFLKSLGINKIDVVVATHADMDHIGGLTSVLDEMKVGKIIMPHSRHTTRTHDRLLKLIYEKGVGFQFGRRGQRIDICPDVRIDILHPIDEWVAGSWASENDRSIVMRLVYGGTSAIFTGDIGEYAKEEILENVPDISSDVLKVSHHGAKSGSSKAFLAAVRPRIAVISAGRNNLFGHPAPEVIDRLTSMRAAIYRTDRDGAIFLRSDGNSWKSSVFCNEDVLE